MRQTILQLIFRKLLHKKIALYFYGGNHVLKRIQTLPLRPFLLLFIVLSIYTTASGQKTENFIYLETFIKPVEQETILEDYTVTRKFTERNSLDTEIDSLQSKLKERGYFDLTTEIVQKNDSTTQATFSLGQLYANLRLSIGKDERLARLIEDSGFTINQDSIKVETAFAKAYLQQLTSIAANNGYPFARFQIKDIKREGDFLSGKLKLTIENSRKVDDFVIRGYSDFPQGYLKHYAKLRKGVPFNQSKLSAQNETLRTLSFVNSEKEPEILFKEDSTTVFFYLSRNNVNRFDGFLGFATNEDNKLRLDGYLDLLLTNNLNYGESFSLNYKADGEDQSQLKINARFPYILSSPVGVEASIALFRRDSTFSTSDLQADLFYTLSPSSTVSLGYLSRTSENLTDDDNDILQDITDFTSSGLSLSYDYTKRSSDYFFPIKTRFNLSLGYTRREIVDDDEEQVALQSSAEHILSLNETNFVYLRNVTKYLDSDNYVTNELYRFGGIQSIRGFEENSLFANFMSILNTEYRLLLNQGLYVNSVIDLAYFENAISNEKQKLYSLGLGAGLRTQAGLLKINLANGKFENQPFRTGNTRLHIILAIDF